MHVVSQKTVVNIIKTLSTHGHVALVGVDADRYIHEVQRQAPHIFRHTLTIDGESILTSTLRTLQTSTVWGVRTCITFRGCTTVPRWLVDALVSRAGLPPCVFVQPDTCPHMLQRVVRMFTCGRKKLQMSQLVRTKKLQQARDIGGTHSTRLSLHRMHCDTEMSEHLSTMDVLTNRVPTALVEQLEDMCVGNAHMVDVSYLSYPDPVRGREILQYVQPSASKILGRCVSLAEMRDRVEVEFLTNGGYSTLYVNPHQKKVVQTELNRQVALVTQFHNPVCKKRKLNSR
jgi:hypothetical protein